MKRIFTISLAVLLAAGLCADLLILKDGTEINGKIKAYDGNTVTFYNRDTGKTATHGKDVLNRLDVFKEYEEKGVYKTSDIKDPDFRKILDSKKDFKEYSKYKSVTILDDTDIVYMDDGSAVMTYHFIGRVMQESGKNIGTFYIGYIPGESEFEIKYARSITDGKVVYANDYSVTDTSRFPNYPLYEKAKQVKVIIPKVEIGTFVEYCYVKKILIRDILDEPQVYGTRVFSSVPVLKTRFLISAPSSVKMNWVLKNDKKSAVKTVTFKRNSKEWTKYEYTKNNVTPYEEEDNLPPANDISPYLSIGPEYTYAEIAQRLGDKFRARNTITDKIRIVANEIVNKAKTDQEKIEALYSYVTKNIKKAGVPPWLSQYYPLDPEEILEKKQGSNIDKTFVFHLLLSACDIKTEIMLLHSKYWGKLDNEIPSIENFADLALKLPDGKLIYVNQDNMTIFEFPIGYMGSFALSLDRGELVEIPFLKQEDTTAYQMNFNSNGDLSASVSQSFQGNSQNRYRQYHYLTKQELDKEWEKRISYVHPRARIGQYSYENLPDLTKPVSVAYKYQANEFPKKAGESMMAFQLPEFYITSASQVAREKRNFPIWYSSPYTEKYEYEIAIPEGFRVAYHPPKTSYNIDGLLFSADFSQEQGKLLLNVTYNRKGTLFPAENYQEYKKFVEDVVRFQEEWIVIEKE